MKDTDPPDPAADSWADTIMYADKVDNYLPAIKAFTLNPNPSKYKSYDPYKQYKSLLQCILYKRIDKVFERFLFIPELTEDGNVHIHGYFNIKDDVKFYKWFLPMCKQWGYTKIKPKVDSFWTFTYIPKTVEKLANIMEDLPVPLTSDNYQYYYDNRPKIDIKCTMTKVKSVKITKKKSILTYFK